MSAPTVAPTRLSFVADLARHGESTALIEATTGETLTYTELAARVDAEAARLGGGRRLVQIALDRSVEGVVTYLAALSAGHVTLLAPTDSEQSRALLDLYDPDVVAMRRDGAWTVMQRRSFGAHVLHPDLAVLMTTSGSTGSPKLVRLASDNVQANAEQIAEALGISATDRAVTSLPLSYSYGLSVLHSHFLAGASVLLTERSVVDARFWDAMAAHSVTTLAGVPYTFEMLDRVGFSRMRLPALRHVTAAGGRLGPDQVRRFAQLGRTQGFALHVMYGQTEATARIATLDPDQALTRPESIGRPVPGGEISLETVDEQGVGEMVYRGPNVMLGYATSPADLARGRSVDALRTGDLARQDPDGSLTVVGRRSRITKVFGLRIDLDQVERQLAEQGVACCVSGTEQGLCVVAEGRIDPDHLADLTARASGLPLHVIRARVVAALPRLASGKLDRATACSGCDQSAGEAAETAQPALPSAEDIRALYAQLLGRPDAGLDSSFVQLGGDSLSYVEVSVRLEALLGALPADWHTLAPSTLAERAQPRRRWTAQLETGVLLRAVAIVAIVGTHIGVFDLLGGAHVLLGLAGFAMARFLLDPVGRRASRVLRGAARIAVPSAIWIAVATLVTGAYGWQNVALLGTVLGPDEWGPTWHFWFIEALVLYLLVTAALFAVPVFDRAERRWPFLVVGGVVAVALLVRFDLVPGLADPRPTPAPALYYFWFFALGWWASRAGSNPQRWLVTAVIVVSVAGFWQNTAREVVVIAGLVLLTWVSALHVPRVSVPVLTRLASASLAVYLTHWLVYPPLERWPLLALVVSLVAGVTTYEVFRLAMNAAKSSSFWSAYASAYSAKDRSARSLLPR